MAPEYATVGQRLAGACKGERRDQTYVDTRAEQTVREGPVMAWQPDRPSTLTSRSWSAFVSRTVILRRRVFSGYSIRTSLRFLAMSIATSTAPFGMAQFHFSVGMPVMPVRR